MWSMARVTALGAIIVVFGAFVTHAHTTETYRGQRVQKFTYKGLSAVTAPHEGGAVAGQ